MNTMRRGIVVIVTVALAMSLTALPVLAFDARAGDNVTIGAGEVVDEDVYLAGRVVSSSAPLNGDVFAAGQNVTIGGSVANGLTVAGQTVMVTAPVGHGVRAAGSTVDIVGDVGRDLLAAAATLVVHDSATIAGDISFGSGTALIRGDVAGNVLGGAEELTIEGSVGGNVIVEVGTLVIKPGATIAGNLIYTGRTQAVVPAGAVMGTVTFTQRADNDTKKDPSTKPGATPLSFFAGLTWKFIAYLMAFLTGLVLIVVSPRRMAVAASAIRTATGAVAGYGAIALFVVPLAAIVVCLTVIGLPLGIITLLLWGILLYLSQLPVSLLIGHLILGRQRHLEGKGFMIGCLALGLLVLTLLRAIPYVGSFVWLAIALFGLGAFVVGELRREQWRHSGDEYTLL